MLRTWQTEEVLQEDWRNAGGPEFIEWARAHEVFSKTSILHMSNEDMSGASRVQLEIYHPHGKPWFVIQFQLEGKFRALAVPLGDMRDLQFLQEAFARLCAEEGIE